MSTEELLRERMVKWVAKVRVRGVPGTLEGKKELRVEGADYQRSCLQACSDVGGRLLGNVVSCAVALLLLVAGVILLFWLF